MRISLIAHKLHKQSLLIDWGEDWPRGKDTMLNCRGDQGSILGKDGLFRLGQGLVKWFGYCARVTGTGPRVLSLEGRLPLFMYKIWI
jgi:hypothetical protein